MSISFSGAKNYKLHNGFSEIAGIKKPLASPIHSYPLRQNQNLLIEPLIKEGDRILKNEKIADLDVFSAIPCISSVSGRVISVSEERITVENDFLDDEALLLIPEKKADDMTSRELLWLIRESGIIEPRTGIPVHVTLSQGKVPSDIIVCCFDSDPYVSSVQMSAVANAEKILYGLDIILRILCIKKAFIAVESNAKKTYSDFKYLLRYNKNISLYSLKPRYPQSRSDILIKTLTGKSDDGISHIIFTPETLCNISDAVKGIRITEKIVTVSGDDILEPSNFKVPLGAYISTVLTSAGYSSPEKIISGGIFDGKAITDADTPVTSDTKAIIAFNDKNNIPPYRKELN